jgi:hypothetical protein
LFGVLPIGLGILLLCLSGLRALANHSPFLDPPTGPAPLLSPGQQATLAVVLISFSFAMAFYGLWLVILAPFLGLALPFVWLASERPHFQPPRAGWTGAVLVMALPFLTTSHVYERQIVYSPQNVQTGILSAAKHAPFWSDIQRIKLLKIKEFPTADQPEATHLVTQLWLRSTLPNRIEKYTIEQLKGHLWRLLKETPSLQQPALAKLMRYFRRTRHSVAFTFGEKSRWTLTELYHHLPALRPAIQQTLKDALFEVPVCHSTKPPTGCRPLLPKVLLRHWLSNTLQGTSSPYKGIPISNLTNDFFWELLKELHTFTPHVRDTLLAQALQQIATKKPALQTNYAGFFLFELFTHGRGSIMLHNIKIPSIRKQVEQALSHLTKVLLRDTEPDRQKLGMLLFGAMCRSHSTQLSLATCNGLVPHFQRDAWTSLQKQARDRYVKGIIHRIQKPGLIPMQWVTCNKRVLLIRGKWLQLQRKRLRLIRQLLASQQFGVHKDKRKGWEQESKRLKTSMDIVDKEYKKAEAACRTLVPFPPKPTKRGQAPAPKRQPSSRPTSRPVKR